MPNQISRNFQVETLTIASSASTSDACECGSFALFGLVMPAAFTGTALTFTVSHDGTTFQALYDTSNAAVSLTVAVSRSYDLPTALASWPYFKLVSNGTEASARTITVVKKG